MNFKIRKFLSIILMLAMLVSAFSACAGGDSEKESDSTESESASYVESSETETLEKDSASETEESRE